MKVFIVLVLICLVLLVTGCGRQAELVKVDRRVQNEIIIASAASMKPALSAITSAFEQRTGNKTQIVLSSSGLLARQIESGAPYDVYISADRAYMEQLAEQDLVYDVQPFAQGVIVLVGKIATLDGLREKAVKSVAIANPDIAPYGAAAKEALEKAGLWAAVEGKLVVSENVGQAHDFVATGNVDAGIVALSLAKATKTDYADIDGSLYQPIEQWAGIVRGSDLTRTAERFIDHLQRTSARKTLEKYGFKASEVR